MAAFSRRITAGRRPSSGPGRPPLGGGHAQRALNAGSCTVFGQPVLFSTSKVDLLLSLATPSPAARARRCPPSATLARSRPFDPAAVLRDHRIVYAHALPVRCFCRCAGRGQGGGEARAAPSSRSPAASWATPGARSPPLAARSGPFEPGAARKSRLFAPLHDSLCGCCCSQGKGRRRRERAGSSCTRLRHEKDDDKEDKKKVETVLISTI
jgi:hypothetical protein